MKKTNNRGFSLVELIVVIAIMAVLIGVLAPQFLRYVDKARIQKDNTAIAEIANAAKIAMADEDVYNDLVKDGYKLSSIKVVAAVLNGCMQQAMRNGLIERNPVKLAELPRQTEKKTRQAMTKDQQTLFMEYAKESYLYNFFAVMLRTGMRTGEMEFY